MQALVINAIEGRIDQLRKVFARERATTVGAIFALGRLAADADASAAGGPAAAAYAPIFDALGALEAPVYFVPGAGDAPLPIINQALQSYAGNASLHLVHRAAAFLGDGDVVAGFGGLLTAEEDSESERWRYPGWEPRVAFDHLASFNSHFQLAQRRLLLFATPPRGALVDCDGQRHVGAQVIDGIIRTHQPHLVCCGGPAAGRGVEQINGTPVLNPGPLSAGCYALVDLADLKVRLERLPEPLPSVSGAISSVLVAIDGSPESWRALELAAGIARGYGARLTLLHAFDHVIGALALPYDDQAIGQRVMRGEKLLAEASDYVADLSPQVELLEGPAADAIVRVAEIRHSDLIVMGARSHGGFSALIGSVSRQVLRHAPCSVLVTRQQPSSPLLMDRTA